MKTLSRIAKILGGLAALAPALVGQVVPKVLVVDMARLYDTHPKTVEQNTKLKADEKGFEGEIEKLNAEGTALVSQYRQLMEQTTNAALGAEAKTKAQEAAQGKLQDIQKKNSEVQAFRANAQRQLQQRVAVFRESMLREIGAVAADIAKRRGATMLIDRAGPSLIGISPFVYLDPSFDITEDVMKELLKGTTVVPPPGAAAAAPKAADVPATVTFPGSGKP